VLGQVPVEEGNDILLMTVYKSGGGVESLVRETGPRMFVLLLCLDEL